MSDEIELDPPDYSAAYSDENFWEKCKKFLRKAGKTVLVPALTLKYCAEDPDTPKHIKAHLRCAGLLHLPHRCDPRHHPHDWILG